MRLLLALSVSMWMAGGCLFGCFSNTGSSQTVVATESCHSHTAHKATQPRVLSSSSVAPTPRGMTQDCPLAVNATAVTSKSSGKLPAPGRVAVATLPLIESTAEYSNASLVTHVPPNRGPTYLRCCVFLI